MVPGTEYRAGDKRIVASLCGCILSRIQTEYVQSGLIQVAEHTAITQDLPDLFIESMLSVVIN